MFTSTFIASNPAKFITSDWVNIQDLKNFIQARNSSQELPISVEKTCSERVDMVTHTRVKADPDAVSCNEFPIKPEPNWDALLPPADAHDVKIKTLVASDGQEYIEILDSDESDMEIPKGIKPDDTGMSSDTLVGNVMDEDDSDDEGSDIDMSEYSVDEGISEASYSELSETVWLDSDIASRVSDTPRRLNRQLLVDRVEYLHDIPTYWPVPRVKAAYILDLSDPKFDIEDPNGKLLPIDTLIKDKVSITFQIRCTSNNFDNDYRIRIPGPAVLASATPRPHSIFSRVNRF